MDVPREYIDVARDTLIVELEKQIEREKKKEDKCGQGYSHHRIREIENTRNIDVHHRTRERGRKKEKKVYKCAQGIIAHEKQIERERHEKVITIEFPSTNPRSNRPNSKYHDKVQREEKKLRFYYNKSCS